MIFEYVLIFIVIALLKKGSFKRLSETHINVWYLFVASFFLQIIAMYFYHRSLFIEIIYPFLIVGSYFILIYGIWKNHELPGFKLFGFGTLLNLIAIIANGGRMPVSTEALTSSGLASYIPRLMEGTTKHQIVTNETNLWFLADIIPLRPPFVFSSSVISMGDIAITLGIAWFIYKRMLR